MAVTELLSMMLSTVSARLCTLHGYALDFTPLLAMDVAKKHELNHWEVQLKCIF